MELQNNHVLAFEEVEATELNGNVRDALEGFGWGIGTVAAVAGIVSLT